MGKTLYEKVFDAHTVRRLPSGQVQLLMGLHLIHGAWSMFQSLGINNPRYNKLRRSLATGLAGVTQGNRSIHWSSIRYSARFTPSRAGRAPCSAANFSPASRTSSSLRSPRLNAWS